MTTAELIKKWEDEAAHEKAVEALRDAFNAPRRLTLKQALVEAAKEAKESRDQLPRYITSEIVGNRRNYTISTMPPWALPPPSECAAQDREEIGWRADAEVLPSGEVKMLTWPPA